MSPIAIITMVYDDDIYLEIWLKYWEQFVPRSNLYVLIHDQYEKYEDICKGCNTIRVHRPAPHSDFENARWRMLSDLASSLTHYFEKVIYTDVDEIIALDPEAGDDPVAYILNNNDPVLTPFGVELIHLPEQEPKPLSLNQTVLSQRQYFSVWMAYAKPAIISKPVRWSTGGHFVDQESTTLDPKLVLFHLRLFDQPISLQRMRERRKMVTDPATGELIEGLGASSWRNDENDLLAQWQRFIFDNKKNLTQDFKFPGIRKKWLLSQEILVQEGHEFYKRSYLRKWRVNKIPKRFETLF
jgi:hypothetical protein